MQITKEQMLKAFMKAQLHSPVMAATTARTRRHATATAMDNYSCSCVHRFGLPKEH